MAKATDIFTPTKRPTITTVRRENLWRELEELIEQGGGFVSILGTTKLGKSTLLENALGSSIFAVILPGQRLTTGAPELWARLVDVLGIHTTQHMVRANIKNRGISGGVHVGSSEILSLDLQATRGTSSEEVRDREYVIDPPTAVQQAFAKIGGLAGDDNNPPIVAIDDFHFVTDPATRREIVLALRPIAESNVTIILTTLPGREDDGGFEGTNVGGRHYVVPMPRWEESELREIAVSGFRELEAKISSELVDRLVNESFGSPQIMQQLCLNLCRANKLKKTGDVAEMSAPNDWETFFRQVNDPHSAGWLRRLGLGLTPRRSRNLYETNDGRELDGYQLILQAMRESGGSEASLSDLKSRIGGMTGRKQSEINKMNLDQIARNMNVVASRDMTEALEALAQGPEDPEEGPDGDLDGKDLFSEEAVRMAQRIPQPVFEVVGKKGSEMVVRTLDPLLEYTLKWHPETFLSRATR